MNVLNDAGCTRDDIRLVRFLLSGTKLRVRVNKSMSTEFETNIGSFQGDALSGKLFTLTLAGVLNHARTVTSQPNPPISNTGMPMEFSYADDVIHWF